MIETSESRQALVDHDIAAPLRARWSPRTFDGSTLSDTVLLQLLEAARWAPSSANEQPWRFLLAPRSDEAAFARALDCLKPGNRGWAAGVSLLMFTFAKKTFARSGGENLYGWHDVGLAIANLSFQATSMGLYVHQMGGILRDAIIASYDVPDDFDVVSGVAVGRLGDPSQLSDEQRERERRPRTRKPLEELVFAETFGRPAAVVAAQE